MASDFLREIAGPAGPLEALLDAPGGEPRAVAVFGHPHPLHGGTMHTKALYQAAKAMPRIGVAALRFNFRGVGRSAGTFDAGPGEMEDFKAAIAFMSERYPDLPIWAGGHVVRIVDRDDRRRRGRARVAAARHRAAGRSLRLRCAEDLHAAEIHHPRRGRRADFDQGCPQVLFADPRAERARDDRGRQPPVRRQDVAGR